MTVNFRGEDVGMFSSTLLLFSTYEPVVIQEFWKDTKASLHESFHTF